MWWLILILDLIKNICDNTYMTVRAVQAKIELKLSDEIFIAAALLSAAACAPRASQVLEVEFMPSPRPNPV